MTKLMYLLSCYAVCMSSLSSASSVDYPPVDGNVRYKQVTGLGFKPATRKLVYGHADNGLRYGLLWLPAEPPAAKKSPLVILIHGGCWLNAFNIEHTYPLSTALAQTGYAVWSLEYSRTGDAGGGWPGTFEDIKAGLAYTSRLGEFHIDLDQVVIAGHSAGGHLAIMAGGEFKSVKAVIGLAAITDIIEYSRGTNSCQRATLDFMGGGYEAKADAYRLANPVGKELHPNTILLHGDIDAVVPVDQSTRLDAKPDVLTGAGHFDWVHPGTPAYTRLLKTLDEVLNQ